MEQVTEFSGQRKISGASLPDLIAEGKGE